MSSIVSETATGREWLRVDALRRRARAALALIASVAVVACSAADGNRAQTSIYRLLGSERNPGMETLEQTIEYQIVPPSRAMINAPQALVVFERGLARAVEQRIILPNATTMAGDNVIQVRAQTPDSARLEEFAFEDVAARFGGLPAPFERLTVNALESGRDSLGTYVFAREQFGTNINCVLVMRRIGLGARPLPRGTQALDLVLRNCVNGTFQQALAAMDERALSVSATPTGSILNLSPYAAPGG